MEPAAVDAPPANVLGALLQQLVARVNQRRARRGCSPLSPKAAYPWLREAPSLPQPDNQADALAVLTARAGRCITAADVDGIFIAPGVVTVTSTRPVTHPWRPCSRRSAKET
ncbi:hypothetical protein ACWCQZ_46760 [Streptomyces sp. NPDC002285]